MRKDLITSLLAVLIFTLILGVAYPLVVTGAAQLLFPNAARGSMVEHQGRTVGSRLIAQPFAGNGYFQPRPSQTEYAPAQTAFNNAGPNNRATRDLIAANAREYLARERRYSPGLTLANLPVDAATGSASGVDPHISLRNADIQANRVARVRGIAAGRMSRLIDEATDGRFLGVLGEPGVNVLELNIALENEVAR